MDWTAVAGVLVALAALGSLSVALLRARREAGRFGEDAEAVDIARLGLAGGQGIDGQAVARRRGAEEGQGFGR